MFSAQKALMDQRFLYLDAEIFDDVLKQVSRPAKANPKLAALMKTENKWATSEN